MIQSIYDPRELAGADFPTGKAGSFLKANSAFLLLALVFLFAIQERFGNGVQTTTTFNLATGNLTGIATSGQVQNVSYDYYTGHLLKSRTDKLHGLSETFAYDNLNRLNGSLGSTTKSYTYYANGNLNTKSDVGTYLYGTTVNGMLVQPHAVTSVTSGSNVNATYVYDANCYELFSDHTFGRIGIIVFFPI